MRVTKDHRPARETETVDEMPAKSKKRDDTDLDELLDKIDDLLDNSVAEVERKRSWRDKILSIGQIRRGDPCEQQQRWIDEKRSQGYVIRHGGPVSSDVEYYDGPPCVGC